MTSRLKVWLLVLAAMGFGYFLGYDYSKTVHLQEGRDATEKLTATLKKIMNDGELMDLDVDMILLKHAQAGEIDIYQQKLCFMTAGRLKRLTSLRGAYFSRNPDKIPPFVVEAKRFVDEQTAKGNCSAELKPDLEKR